MPEKTLEEKEAKVIALRNNIKSLGEELTVIAEKYESLGLGFQQVEFILADLWDVIGTTGATLDSINRQLSNMRGI